MMEPNNALFHLIQTCVLYHEDEGHLNYFHLCDDPDCQLNWESLSVLAEAIGTKISKRISEELETSY